MASALVGCAMLRDPRGDGLFPLFVNSHVLRPLALSPFPGGVHVGAEPAKGFAWDIARRAVIAIYVEAEPSEGRVKITALRCGRGWITARCESSRRNARVISLRRARSASERLVCAAVRSASNALSS
jgi:hypothetical protein